MRSVDLQKTLSSRQRTSSYIFIGIIVIGAIIGLGLAFVFLWHDADLPEHKPSAFEHEAMFWQEMADNKVWCQLCFQNCMIPEGHRGICRVRENREGSLYTLVYGRLASTMIAEIEKDGMQHALPGTDVLAIATAGCNFRCKQCHNWHITQRGPEDVRARQFTPQEVVDFALRRGARTISGTINEPTVFFEFLYDVAILAREQGLRMQFHTNGAIAEEPLRALLQRFDQAVVDLKGFCPDVYREYFGGCLDSVLRTLKVITEKGAWLEITNLVIPTVNDCMDEIKAMSEWIVEHLGPDVPLHFTRFSPAYRLTHLPRTPIETLEEAHAIARKVGINFVTIGNVAGHRYNSTFCPCTGERLIHRVHFAVIYNRIVDGISPFSGRLVPGIWE